MAVREQLLISEVFSVQKTNLDTLFLEIQSGLYQRAQDIVDTRFADLTAAINDAYAAMMEKVQSAQMQCLDNIHQDIGELMGLGAAGNAGKGVPNS